jgi:hypothetical protein
MPTRNVTLAISREAHLKARIWAAHYDVSLSAIIATLLEGLPGNPNAARAAERIHEQRNHPTPLPPCEIATPADTAAKSSSISGVLGNIPQVHESCEDVSQECTEEWSLRMSEIMQQIELSQAGPVEDDFARFAGDHGGEAFFEVAI